MNFGISIVCVPKSKYEFAPSVFSLVQRSDADEEAAPRMHSRNPRRRNPDFVRADVEKSSRLENQLEPSSKEKTTLFPSYQNRNFANKVTRQQHEITRIEQMALWAYITSS